MAMREARPYWKKTHRCWYFRRAGVDVRLDADKKKAHELWRKLRALDPNESAKLAANPAASVAELFDLYLEWVTKNRKPTSYRCYAPPLQSFVSTYPNLRICDLRVLHVTQWADATMKNVGPATRRMRIDAVKRAVNWCVDQGYIDKSPIRKVERPPAQRRGEEAYLSPNDWQDLVEDVKQNASPEFLDYITVLYRTGCRPQEIRMVEARHYNREGKFWSFAPPEAKKGDVTGKHRIVHLGPEAAAICDRLADKWPTGPMFRNTAGEPWTSGALCVVFARIRKRTGIKCCPYNLRHTFVTDAVLNGTPLLQLMVLVGHKDLSMITKVYQHIEGKRDTLKAALAQVNSGARVEGAEVAQSA